MKIMENILNNKILNKYIDWFYDFLFYYSEEKTVAKKVKAILMAVTPIFLAIGYITLIILYFLTNG